MVKTEASGSPGSSRLGESLKDDGSLFWQHSASKHEVSSRRALHNKIITDNVAGVVLVAVFGACGVNLSRRVVAARHMCWPKYGQMSREWTLL